LADNALTFMPSSPLKFLTSLTHLDLSSNLLISVPPGLSVLHNLISLNLSDNMIDSVLGISTMLGQVLTLNLSRNRLDSLCGLERLVALERVDVRDNKLEDTGEVGRLAVLPNISEIWIKGNTFVRADEEYRVKCFEYFAQENKSIQLDGSAPSFLEARSMKTVAAIIEDPIDSRRNSSAPSPPVVAVGSPQSHSSHWKRLDPSVTQLLQGTSNASPPTTPDSNANRSSSTFASPSSANSVPVSTGQSKPPKKRKPKRIVDLDGTSVSVPGSGVADLTAESHNDPSIASSESNAHAKSRHTKRASDSADTLSLSHVPLSAFRQSNGVHIRDVHIPEPVGRSPSTFRPKGSRRGSHARHATEGNLGSLSEERSRRQSASVYEPPDAYDGIGGGDGVAIPPNEADAYRARIEALRGEVGDSWLKVLNQSGGFAGDHRSDAKRGMVPMEDVR